MNKLESPYIIELPHYDYLLVAGGSDYRAYEALRKCLKNKVLPHNVIIFDFTERTQEIHEEGLKQYNEYRTLVPHARTVSCSIMNPSECLKSLIKAGVHLSADQAIALDISCFTKPYYFSIIKYLKERVGLQSITVFYTEPMSYVFSKGLYNSYHSGYGPLAVREIHGFPGIDTRTEKKILIILLGFDGELATFITEEIAPDETVIVNGFPSYSPKFKDISLINNEKLVDYYSSPRQIKYVEANNPFETFNLLESLKLQYPTSFINVAPIGTKPMALGACLFAILYPSVRIIYPFPEHYANITTDQCWQSWAYELPLIAE